MPEDYMQSERYQHWKNLVTLLKHECAVTRHGAYFAMMTLDGVYGPRLDDPDGIDVLKEPNENSK